MVPNIATSSVAGGASLKLGELRSLADGPLLARFFEARDDVAFSVLTERYGPLVYGVCRRILADANDAEDAFQATFLVLVRKGGALRDPGRLASWLYGVAYRTARKAKARAALRTRSERQAGEMPTKSASSDMTLQELHAVLDQEISQLPEKYALPLVLCYLEGKTNAQAAEQLGWPEGSISRRLSRARELLRSRLARRGLALSAALITAVFARPASAAVPRELLLATTRAATLVADGIDPAEVVSPSAAKLLTEVLLGMSPATRFALPSVLALAALMLLTASAVWQFGSPVQAAGLFKANRGNVHALQGTGVAATGLAVPGGAATGSCGAPTATAESAFPTAATENAATP